MKKLSVTLLIIMSGLIIFTAAGFIVLIHTIQVPRFSAFLAQKSIALSLIRWMLLALLAYLWPVITKFLAKWQAWPLDVENRLMALRWSIICYLVFFEMLVMQNTLACCLDFLVH